MWPAKVPTWRISVVLDWLTETTLYLPPFKGVVPTQHSSILGVGPYCGLTAYIEARCHCRGVQEQGWGSYLGPSLGPRSYSSRCSFPMTSHWMIGMQEYTPCPLCGLMCLCWEPTICVEWLAMTFTAYGRSMMSPACGATSTHNGDYCSSIWNQRAWLVPALWERRAAFYQQV